MAKQKTGTSMDAYFRIGFYIAKLFKSGSIE